MANKVPEFPFRTRRTDYPWDEWFDGSIWEIGPDDYSSRNGRVFAAAVYQQAKRRGLDVRVSRRGDTIYVQKLGEHLEVDRRPVRDAPPRREVCPVCDGTLPQRRRPEKRYCSAACKQKAWRERPIY
jgi:hypothetical protein